MARFSVSLPAELSRHLRRIATRERTRISHIFAEALREYVARHNESAIEKPPQESPTVLWKLKVTGRMAMRSPKLTERRLRESWVVEEY